MDSFRKLPRWVQVLLVPLIPIAFLVVMFLFVPFYLIYRFLWEHSVNSFTGKLDAGPFHDPDRCQECVILKKKVGA